VQRETGKEQWEEVEHQLERCKTSDFHGNENSYHDLLMLHLSSGTMAI
jgi:hypothetical protein